MLSHTYVIVLWTEDLPDSCLRPFFSLLTTGGGLRFPGMIPASWRVRKQQPSLPGLIHEVKGGSQVLAESQAGECSCVREQNSLLYLCVLEETQHEREKVVLVH